MRTQYFKNGRLYTVLQRVSRCKICGLKTFRRGDQALPPSSWCMEHWKAYRSNYMKQWYKTPTGKTTLNKAVQSWRRNHKEKWAEIMANYRDRTSNKAHFASTDAQ